MNYYSLILIKISNLTCQINFKVYSSLYHDSNKLIVIMDYLPVKKVFKGQTATKIAYNMLGE